MEETYDIVRRSHIATGHGGRQKMLKDLNSKYANITRETVELFKDHCLTCFEKTRSTRSGVVIRPLLSQDFNSRVQIDLIDFQSSAYRQFKFILVVQCHLTKFIILRPLRSKRAAEIAHELLDIFLLFGAPLNVLITNS